MTAAYWFTSSTSIANPAVTIARTLSGTGKRMLIPNALNSAEVGEWCRTRFDGALLCGFRTRRG